MTSIAKQDAGALARRRQTIKARQASTGWRKPYFVDRCQCGDLVIPGTKLCEQCTNEAREEVGRVKSRVRD